MAKADLTADELRRIFHYDPQTDTWTRVVAHKMRPDAAGRRAGCWDNGYLNIKVGSQKFKAHRLVWLWHHGKWPTGHIDHIDGDTTNNRIENLRDASRAVNAQNQRKPHANSTTGFLGVKKFRGRYVANITVHNVRHWLGAHDTPEQAYQAYVDAKRRLHEGNTL